MAQFKALSPGVEVNGQTVLSIVDGMGAFKDAALAILKKSGIENPQPDHFYPQQAWLTAFKEIAEKFGPSTLTMIGKKIPENAIFPPEINTIEKALSAIDMAYHMNHRGGEIGHYRYQSSGEKSARLVCNNPYPCDFDRGIIMAMSRRFAPAGKTPKIVHDDSQPCRKNGADSCTYLVSWA